MTIINSTGILYTQMPDGSYGKVGWAEMPLTVETEEDQKIKSVPEPQEVTLRVKIPLSQQRKIKQLMEIQRRFYADLRLLLRYRHILLHTKSRRIRLKAYKRIIAMPIFWEAWSHYFKEENGQAYE